MNLRSETKSEVPAQRQVTARRVDGNYATVSKRVAKIGAWFTSATALFPQEPIDPAAVFLAETRNRFPAIVDPVISAIVITGVDQRTMLP